MVDTIMHIGFGKTGTSSLQSFLSTGGLADTQYEYCAIDPDGEVLVGSTLRARTARSEFGYTASAHYLGRIDHQRVRVGLAAIRDRGKIPILSQEYWSAIGDTFKTQSLLTQWGVSNAFVIAYVRPQVEYINSGWWQWWRWNGKFDNPSDIVVENACKKMLWAKELMPWSAIAGRLSVRLHCEDTVGDFASLLELEIDASEVRRKNPGMCLELIQLYHSLPGLRTEHGSDADSFLSSLMRSSKTPWVIPRRMAEETIECCRSDNLALIDLLSEGQRLQMRNNIRWWSAEAYPEVEEVLPMPPTELTGVFSKVLAARIAAQEEATDMRESALVAERDLSALRAEVGELRVLLKMEHDALASARNATETLQTQTESLRGQLAEIQNSTLWQTMRPLRGVLQYVPCNVRRLSKRALKVG
jgi:hypothetical protein